MRHQRIGAVVRVSLGNFLEMYDFMVFGYYAAAIGRAFFPTQNEYASLMLSFMTFGTGYLMRPLGAVVLGAYVDHHGRRKGLLLTLSLMAVGTVSIGVMPGYETIGLFAPLLVVAGRLLRRSLIVIDDFRARQHHPSTSQIWRTVIANWPLMILRMMLSITTTVTFYLITAYMPTYGSGVLHLSTSSSMLVTLLVGISN